ncbi:MAG: D-glycero-beta-D-manno-heptose 1,7-bisphosphate 7-phosphatase [Thiotrichaceae bacterium]|nr:D-glycero-beta-D-manno-heptose 1,7-bisphosphate 7-phosphatase [Thiotrichaceae bacterium]
MTQLIILDRDGVINEDSDHYIKSLAEWIPITGSIKAIANLKDAGYRVAIATNQSGIARGYYDLDTLKAMHDQMTSLLSVYGQSIDYITYCPHKPDDHCLCRKPKTGMIDEILEKLAIPASDCLFIGDSLGDYKVALASHIEFALVRTGKGERTIRSGELAQDTMIYDDLSTIANKLCDTRLYQT